MKIFFAFFYINRRKYSFRANFPFPVFDGFTHFGCPEDDLTIFGKSLSVYLWQNFLACVVRELLNRISWNFMFSIIPIQISVCQLLVEMVLCKQTFSRFLGWADLRFLLIKSHNNLCKNYIVLEKKNNGTDFVNLS